MTIELKEELEKSEIKVFLTWNKYVRQLLDSSLPKIEEVFGSHCLGVRLEMDEEDEGEMWVKIATNFGPAQALTALDKLDNWWIDQEWGDDAGKLNFNIEFTEEVVTT